MTESMRVALNADVREQLCIEIKPDCCGIVIFGASGDLTRRKLLPALFNLYVKQLLPKSFFIMGCARSAMDDVAFRKLVRASLWISAQSDYTEAVEFFLKCCYYQSGNYDDESLYNNLTERLANLKDSYGTYGNCLFYLATPPSLFNLITEGLGKAKLNNEAVDGRQWARVVIEKPFGRDLASSIAVDQALKHDWTEQQIYRIDHYLGKETVQNILILRFANAIFEPLWSNTFIDHVQITVAETLGVENRAGYYEQAGALRDMFQNHMIQMLALVAMEPPAQFTADWYRDEIVKLIRSIRPFPLDHLSDWVVRGQYQKGAVNGQPLCAYREEAGIDPQSTTDTYIAMKVMIDNWRWEGVPFYLRSGKRLNKGISEIAITFKSVPHSIFHPIRPEQLAQNVLVLKIQPEEGIGLTLEAKTPGPRMCMNTLSLNFAYRDIFGETAPNAYERLLLDCMTGDQTLFVRSDTVELAWSVLEPVLNAWQQRPEVNPLCFYEAGSWGPEKAQSLLTQDGKAWRNL